MSRTYTHGMKARERYFASSWKGPRNEWHDPLRGSRPKLKRHKQELHWMTTPGSWNYVMHTRPWRRRMDRETRAAILDYVGAREWVRQAYDEYLPDHSGRFPGSYRKPHQYYW